MKHCIHLKIFSNLLFCLVRCLCKYLWVCPLKPNKEELLKFKAKHNKRNKLGKYFFSWQKVSLWIFGLECYWKLQHIILLEHGFPLPSCNVHLGAGSDLSDYLCAMMTGCLYVDQLISPNSNSQKLFLHKQWQFWEQFIFKTVNLIDLFDITSKFLIVLLCLTSITPDSIDY